MSDAPHPAAQACCPPALICPPATAAGSRRRRLWELSPRAHCPVVGVCLSLAALRRLAGKTFGGEVLADDYALHSGAVQDCLQRSPLAEALQRELDRRHALALRRVAALKTTDALRAWWQDAQQGDDLAGALWATLTHARCDEAFEEQVLHDIHLRQHQLGERQGEERRRLAQLQQAQAALAAELAQLQQRSARAAAEQARKIEQLQGELLSRRAELIGRDTVIASVWDQLRQHEDAGSARDRRAELTEALERQLGRNRVLERELAQARAALEAERRRAATAEEALARAAAVRTAPAQPADEVAPALGERAVLCVGGRVASVPVYRRLVERLGGRFLHHDGGEHDHPGLLDHTLASADLVICQTGCISHDAYWRVKDHCKRTGKR
ncbi:DUF2325 domain-containing protein [Piscinibacter defluvii]|uniref:DUF2325 domain-containing protein n=1 Tax=Piscinibacter defluvii TaxID=1796922 RepID=UPI000FDDE35B|nr:DUF2325 domain-containing protein [Piscinibacter defluvii]